MNQGWNVFKIVLDLVIAGLAGFAVTYVGRMFYNLTSTDNPIFFDEHDNPVKGRELRNRSFGEAFGFIFMTRVGYLISFSLATVVCLICAGSGSLDMSDVASDLVTGNQSSATDWGQAQWLVAFLVSMLVTIGFAIITSPRAVETAAPSNGHGH